MHGQEKMLIYYAIDYVSRSSRRFPNDQVGLSGFIMRQTISRIKWIQCTTYTITVVESSTEQTICMP